MSKIIWYHFSDLHFRASDEFDRKQVLSTLWEDVEKQIGAGLLPHFILISGDITYSGQADEYELAENDFLLPLLERTAVDRTRFYMVPGNHDFDRTYLAGLNSATIRSLDSRDSVNTFLSQEHVRNLYLKPFDEYSSFVQRFTGASYLAPCPAYAYHDAFAQSGLTVSIVGLNTAWGCHYSVDTGSPPNDKGRILLGEHQINSVLPPSSHEQFVIILMHHPFDWLAEFEAATLRRLLLQRANVVHHGHVHLASEVSHTCARDHDCFLFGAAAAYDRRLGTDRYANGYSIVALDPAKGSMTVRLRKYVDAPAPHWTSNEDLVGEGSEGQQVFALSSRSLDDDRIRQPAQAVSSCEDLYRACPRLARHLPTLLPVLRSMGAGDREPLNIQLALYEELVCSHYSAHLRLESEEDRYAAALAVLFGEAVIRCTSATLDTHEGKPVLAGISYAASLSGSVLSDSFSESWSTVSGCWLQICNDWEKMPFEMAQLRTQHMATVEHGAVAAVFALVVLLMSEIRIGEDLLHIHIPGVETEEQVTLAPPTRARVVGGSALEVVTNSRNAATFMALMLIRFGLENRLDQIVEVFASINLTFPLQTVRVQLLSGHLPLAERRFSVDTARIIKLMMGPDLYGEESRDVWFREVLQNAIDACSYRARMGDPVESGISVEYNSVERRFVITDSGIGMSLSHIERFFCRVGRSIWRSEEIESQFGDKSAGSLSLGRFGIGFLSVFAAASAVVVTTRFFREEKGHTLKISSPQAPFFLTEGTDTPVGTRVEIRFQDDYRPVIADLVERYIVYRPSGISIDCPSTPPAENLAGALLNEVTVVDSDQVQWYKAEREVASLQARLALVVPMVGKKLGKKQEDKLSNTSSVRVSNGGIAVFRVSSEWIGPERKYSWNDKSSGLRGVRAILDFQAGTAPVTVSRNGVRISEDEANRFIDLIAELGSDAWRVFAEELFQKDGDGVRETRILIRALNRSARPESRYRRNESLRRWCENETLEAAGAALLRQYGVLEVWNGERAESKTTLAIRQLLEAEGPVVVTTQDVARSSLFQLYWTQLQGALLALAPDKRSVDLVYACGEGWTRIGSETEVWSAVSIDEMTEWRLRAVIPAEAAFAPRAYFGSKDVLLAVLPRRRARAEEVVGLVRSEAISVPPRVLLNEAHTAWMTLEKRVVGNQIDHDGVENIFKMLFGLVVDEKSKTRREREFREILKKLLAMCELPQNTKATISV